jgi:hypothetical protein
MEKLRCDNPKCRKEYDSWDQVKGTHRNRKYCSKHCLEQEPQVKKEEDELEKQWYDMPYSKKVRLGIENMDEPYRWKERLQMSMFLDLHYF